MKNLSFNLALFILSFISFSVIGQTPEETASKLRERLTQSKTPADSIRVLYDVFDVLPQKSRIETGQQIYEIAKRTKNTQTQLDILRRIAAGFDDDKTLGIIEKEANRIMPSPEQKETAMFIKLRKISARARKLSEKDRQKEIVKILHVYESTKSKDELHHLLDLYTLVEFMRNDATGDMLKEYVDRMIEIINSSNITLLPLKNLVLAEAASIYSDAEDYEKAIATNKKVLENIEELEKSYKEKGRQYRNFDLSKYVVYRRMLRNAKGLKPGEAENYYQMSMQLAERNREVQEDIEASPRIKAYYYMAVDDYNSAIPVLKNLLAQNSRLAHYKQYLEMLILASEKTGDNKTRIEALEKYSSLLGQLNELEAAQKSRELEIKYDLEDLKERNKDLAQENEQKEIESERSIMTFVTVAFVIILIAFIFLMINWGRYKKNTSRLGRVVDNIHRERYRLRNSLYADYAEEYDPLAQDEDFEQYHWEKRLKQSGESRGDATIFMTESIINDLLFIAATGHANIKKHITDSSVDSILRQAESKARENNPDVSKIRVKYPENDFNVHTDAQCLVSILSHMFDVAHKNMADSVMNLECRNPHEGYMDFVITVEGKGAASSNDPQIFYDMPFSEILLNHRSSALFLCRMMALLMQCELIADMNFTEGTRYYFRVPEKYELN